MNEDHEASAPITYHEAASEPWTGQHDRWDELDLRHHMARSLTILKAQGTYDPARHAPEDAYAPLSLDERLELLARGEVIARHYRHPTQVQDAVLEGATWAQIADATGTDDEQARRDYREWAEGQHRLHVDYEGQFGLDDAAYAAAIAKSEEAQR